MACHLITGDDESLILTAVGELVKQLVGDGDRTLMVDDFDGEEYELRSVVDAAQTAPFLTDTRIVVARGVGRFNTDDVASLVAYLADPLPSTELVLLAGGGRMAKSLTDARQRPSPSPPLRPLALASDRDGSTNRSRPPGCVSMRKRCSSSPAGWAKTPAACRASSTRCSPPMATARCCVRPT